MSPSITLHCNQQWADGTCATSLITHTATLDSARAAARAQGWRTQSDGQDFCPGHSGTRRPPGTNVVALHPTAPQTVDHGADGIRPDGAAADIIRAASAHLKRLATETDEEIRKNPAWHSHLVPKQEWFYQGIDDAVGGSAGRLAGLFSPRNARFVAHVLDRTITPTPGTPNPIPPELFLCAHNIVRSLR
ncbi:hypothetical protein [Streptomyces fagopyri]|uniref:hypothetical protein n=1 Tax=Streptomyces fagopyri TaxID=2662397 RepID=UPI00381B3E10